jgi:branched-chain amino acid transport system ATP-binding protein
MISRSENGVTPLASSTDDPVLVVDGLVVRYGATTALRGVTLAVQRGEIVALLGANGAGKTTTMKAIVGLLRCAEGRVVFDGLDVTNMPPERVTRSGMTLTPEGREVFARLTVDENLRVGAGFAKRAVFEERRAEMQELFPVLHAKAGHFAGLLSGGEQQQLAIARALMADPALLLLDEPSLGLAPIMVSVVFELIEGLRERGVTVLLVEQNVERALGVADRAYVLSTGRLDVSGAADSLGSQAIEEAYLGIAARGG